METLYIIYIVIAILILLWVLFGESTKTKCLSQLNGMWIADEEFCNESGIDLMSIYFNKNPNKPSSEKLCWILILNNNGQYNHITTAIFSKPRHIKGDQYEFLLELEDVPDDIFSTSLKIKIVPNQLITIVDADTDNKIFEGTKNKEASDAIEFNIKEDD
jgi:hypothetical protein